MKKRTAITMISLLSIVTISAVAFAIVTRQRADQDELYISANYRHAFAELVSGVADMDTALQKSLLVTSPSMAGAVCTEVFGKAETAKMALSILPFSSTGLEKTAGFIGRVGDYAYALSRKAARGESFSQEEKDNLRALSETASLLAQNFNSMQNELGSGLISIEEYAQTVENFDKNEDEALPQTLGDGMSSVEQEFPEVPTLIYDGPFSEHPEGVKPVMLEGLDEIDISAGRQVVGQFLGVRPEQVYPVGELAGDIPSFCYETKIKQDVLRITVSKQGGVVYQIIGSRLAEQSILSAKEAVDAAKKFLERKGYDSMRESYYMINNNILTANFAYVDNDVVCYPDLIKVGIAMDDGSVQSFEAIGYLKSHKQRELPTAVVSIESAKEKVPSDISITGTEKTIIPSAGDNEILCYEFNCQDANEQRFLIYVNAATGEQEKIFILLEDENGTLTI
ncbi:MAG: germination protein YpeB [Oscillospiraceae bacterium]|nr:germination protein YpeB [Oscillospiraceae bacterium]